MAMHTQLATRILKARSLGCTEQHRTRMACAPKQTASCGTHGPVISTIASSTPALFRARTGFRRITSYAPDTGASAGATMLGLVREVPQKTMALLLLQYSKLTPCQL